MGYVQAGDGTLRVAGLERILRGKQSVAGSAGSKDLADVIESLAPRVTRTQGQLLEQVVGTELGLEPVVVREAAVVAGANDTETARQTSHIGPCSRAALRGCRAGGCPGRQESSLQLS